MAEYIEREEVMNRLFTEYATDSKADVFELIRSIPAADVQPVNGWINIADKLPINTVTCLVWYEYDGLWGRFRDYGISWYSGNGWYQGFLQGDNITILYWRDLPEPPETKKG